MEVIEDLVLKNQRAIPIIGFAESTGYDFGACILSASDWRKVALFNSALPSGTVDSGALEILSSIFGSATAGSYLLLDEAKRPFQWQSFQNITAGSVRETDRHGNVDLRIGRLVSVQAAFGLSSTELAGVCRVSRAALYKWLSRDEALHLSPVNWSRLSDLAKLADDWNKLTSSPPGQLLREPLSKGQTLLSLLSASQLDRGAIHTGLSKLAEMLKKRPLRRDEKLRSAGIKARPLIGQLQKDE